MIDRYDKTESRRILDQSRKLSPFLAEIQTKPIYDYNDKEWANLKPRIKKLLEIFVSIYGVNVAQALKILHLKRPELFPVLDSYVMQFLTGKKVSSSKRDILLASQSLDLSRELIQSQINEFIQLQNNVNGLSIPLTIVRLFDILCWSTYKWDIQRKTTAPRGKATKSLIEYKIIKPKINVRQVKTTIRGTNQKKKTILSPTSQTRLPTHGKMINKVSSHLSGVFSSKELVDQIFKQYGRTRSINRASLMVDVAGCCINLKSHKRRPDLPLCLVNVSIGVYRRYDSKKDLHLNQYL